MWSCLSCEPLEPGWLLYYLNLAGSSDHIPYKTEGYFGGIRDRGTFLCILGQFDICSTFTGSLWCMGNGGLDTPDDVGTGENVQKFPKSTESKHRYSKGIWSTTASLAHAEYFGNEQEIPESSWNLCAEEQGHYCLSLLPFLPQHSGVWAAAAAKCK